MKVLSALATFISTLLSIHYFYSYRILTGLLKEHHLDYMSIITFEDISLPLGNLNLMIITISGFGLIWIYLWHLLIDNEKKFRKKTKSDINKYSKKLTEWLINRTNITRKFLNRILAVFALIVFASFFFFLIFWNYKADDKQNLVFLFLINFLLIPGMYILKRKNRELILVFYFGFSFLFGVYLIDDTYRNRDVSPQETNKEEVLKIVSFDYNSNHFVTSHDTIMIFNGYKYLILKTKSQGVYDLIPKKDIKNLKSRIVANKN